MANFLTNYNLPNTNQWKSIFWYQFETANLLVNPNTTSYSININVYDQQTIVATYSFPPQSIVNPYVLFTLGIGTANLQGTCAPIGGYIDLSLGNKYEVTVFDGCDSATIRREIVNNCSAFKNVRIMFLNRLGGYDYYNFNYDSKISVNMERKTYNKTLDWNYNVGDRGRSVLTIDADQQTIANTDWISQYDYNFLQELATSPNVYVIDEDNNLKLPIIITDTVWEQKTVQREVIFFMTLTFKYAYNINLQSY